MLDPRIASALGLSTGKPVETPPSYPETAFEMLERLAGSDEGSALMSELSGRIAYRPSEDSRTEKRPSGRDLLEKWRKVTAKCPTKMRNTVYLSEVSATRSFAFATWNSSSNDLGFGHRFGVSRLFQDLKTGDDGESRRCGRPCVNELSLLALLLEGGPAIDGNCNAAPAAMMAASPGRTKAECCEADNRPTTAQQTSERKRTAAQPSNNSTADK